MNTDIKVSMWENDDSERATIRIRSWGGLSQLRFGNGQLRGVAEFSSMDINRLLEAIRQAEQQRIDPDPKMIESLDYVMDRIDYLDEEKTRLYLEVEAEIPISACGSVLFTPGTKDSERPFDGSKDA